MSFGICSVCLHPSERKQEKEGALKGQRMLGGEGEKTRIEEGVVTKSLLLEVKYL